MKRVTPYIGLLRGINVGGHKKILMTELRSLATKIGWGHVQTYIQSGNLVFTASGPVTALEARLEQVIERHLNLQIAVVVRTAADWSAYTVGNPFPDAVRSEPKLVMLALAKLPLKPGAASALQERAADGEQITQVGNALWIHFPRSVAKSKLSPALLNRLAGSPVTVRNWLTVLKLHELAGQVPF